VNPTGLLGLGFIILAVICLVFLIILHKRFQFAFRKIPAFSNIHRAVRLLVEQGTRLHFSLGSGNMLAPDGASALAGLGLLRRLSEIAFLGDRSPIATTGNGILNLLAQGTLHAAHDAFLAGEPFELNNARLTGFTPFAYAAGVIASINSENISSNILIGNFGPEVGLLTEAAHNQNTTVIAASESLTAQAVLYASTPDTLIGEELFSAGAYAQAGISHEASLFLQDILRWLVIIALLTGAALKLVGVL
jgi:hypothetical protein